MQYPMTNKTVYIPDGYFPSGELRPWREAIVIDDDHRFLVCVYKDDGSKAYVDYYAVSTTPRAQ